MLEIGGVMGYLVRLEVYEGPFDLLLNLIERDQIDILDIPIAKIAQEYLAYLKQMQERDLVVSGDFLVIAATLLRIKSTMLLPRNPEFEEVSEFEDPREELIAQLLEYKFYKEVAQTLVDRNQQATAMYPRLHYESNEKKLPIYTNPVGDSSIHQLASLYQQVLHVVKESAHVHEVQRRISLSECMQELRVRLIAGHETTFTQLVGARDRYHTIVTFLAILELVKKREIIIIQHQDFGEIYLELIQDQEVVL